MVCHIAQLKSHCSGMSYLQALENELRQMKRDGICPDCRAARQKAVESPADSPASPVQQLKAEICTLINRGYSTTGDSNGQISERQFINELCKLVGY